MAEHTMGRAGAIVTLRELRLKKGYSLGKLSFRSRIDISLLSRYENAKARPKAANEARLAKGLGVGVGVLREVLDQTKSASS